VVGFDRVGDRLDADHLVEDDRRAIDTDGSANSAKPPQTMPMTTLTSTMPTHFTTSIAHLALTPTRYPKRGTAGAEFAADPLKNY